MHEATEADLMKQIANKSQAGSVRDHFQNGFAPSHRMLYSKLSSKNKSILDTESRAKSVFGSLRDKKSAISAMSSTSKLRNSRHKVAAKLLNELEEIASRSKISGLQPYKQSDES